MMLLKCLALACVVLTVQSRDHEPSRLNKITPPGITSSLINMGKMDISINFNYGKGLDAPSKRPELFSMSHGPSINGFEPCPCSAMKNFVKNPSTFGGPDDFISKILSSNDLFSFNKEPVSSGMCCDSGSHEHVQEETIIFDITKPKSSYKPLRSFGQGKSKSLTPSIVPVAFDFLFGGRPPSAGSGRIDMPRVPTKTNPIEIFFFPNKKVIGNKQEPKLSKKGQPLKKAKSDPNFKDLEIQAVGDKELRNDFKTMNFAPPLPTSASVKKDLTIQEKKETVAVPEETKIPPAVTAVPVSVSAETSVPVEAKEVPAGNQDIYTDIPLVNSNLLKEA